MVEDLTCCFCLAENVELFAMSFPDVPCKCQAAKHDPHSIRKHFPGWKIACCKKCLMLPESELIPVIEQYLLIQLRAAFKNN